MDTKKSKTQPRMREHADGEGRGEGRQRSISKPRDDAQERVPSDLGHGAGKTKARGPTSGFVDTEVTGDRRTSTVVGREAPNTAGTRREARGTAVSMALLQEVTLRGGGRRPQSEGGDVSRRHSTEGRGYRTCHPHPAEDLSEPRPRPTWEWDLIWKEVSS